MSKRSHAIASALWALGYPTEHHGTHWAVYGPGWNGPRVATVSADGVIVGWRGKARAYHAALARV